MRSSDFYDLVSGRRRGVFPAVLRGLLTLIEGPYRAVVWYRNRRFDSVEGAVQRVEVPVISVGNLTLGGTGKTPLVKWIARCLREEGVRVALLSRGYGSDDGGPNDEALELEQSLPDVPHLQNPDRVASARVAIEELTAQVLVLDDGFQHRRLGRDLDIVLLDATAPFGFDHVFPRGSLREPVSGLGRADLVCLTRADRVTSDQRDAIRRRVAKAAPTATWCESVTKPTRLIGVHDDGSDEIVEEAIGSLKGRPVVAFCGIGNPSAFRTMLESLGAEISTFHEFPDHHAYTRHDVDTLQQSIAECDAEVVVCTHKDLVKVSVSRIADRPLRAVAIEAEIIVGEEALRGRLSELAHQATQGTTLEESRP